MDREGLSLQARFEVSKKYAAANTAASKKDKGLILDQVVAVTGWNRDHARQQLRARLRQPKGRAIATIAVLDRRRAKPCRYSCDARKVLQTVWAASGGLCGQYLAASMADWLQQMAAEGSLIEGHGRYTTQVRAELIAMSAATIDRYLAPVKAKDPIRGKTTTKPGSLLRNSITIRKAGDEVEAEPGFFEVDTVAHCGPTLKGEFCRSVNFTDVYTGWVFTRSIRNNAHIHILSAFNAFITHIPYMVTGIDCDNGSEFINHDLIDWATHQKVFFTRSRPYKSNDQATIESKNNHLVRRYGFYHRYDIPVELDLLNQLWTLVYDRLNFLTSPAAFENTPDSCLFRGENHRRHNPGFAGTRQRAPRYSSPLAGRISQAWVGYWRCQSFGPAALQRSLPIYCLDTSPTEQRHSRPTSDAAGQLLRIPPQQALRLLECEPISHAAHVRHGATHPVVDAVALGHRVGPLHVVLHQPAQYRHHSFRLRHGLWAGVDALVVEASQFGERFGSERVEPDAAGGHRRFDHTIDEGGELFPTGTPGHLGNDGWELIDIDDARVDGVFEVVGAVRDAVGPTHQLALDGRRCWPRPGVVADPVEGLLAQIQARQHHIRTPGAVVVATLDEQIERVLARVPAGPVAAVVAERDGVDQRNVDADSPRHGDGTLCYLERVCESRALVIRRVHHHLRLPREPAEGRRMHDPVAVALETGAERVGFFWPCTVARPFSEGGVGVERAALHVLAEFTPALHVRGRSDVARGVGSDQLVAMPTHGVSPLFGPRQWLVHCLTLR